jgi:tetratricopeptide (TPR) repeat protein
MSLLLIFFSLFLHTGWAQSEDNGFLSGIQAYKEQNFQQAQELLAPLVQQYPKNPVLLYNLGLAEYQLGRFGVALGLWRKARTLDQSFEPAAQAIAFTEEQLFPEEQSEAFIVTIYNQLHSFPLWLWALLSLLSFSMAGYWSLEYGVKKQLSPSLWPNWVFFTYPLLVVSSFFALAIYIDTQTPMATVVTKDQSTYASPSETAPTLSQLSEGQIVKVERQHQAWIQVRTQTGAPGWVPEDSIIIFKGL